MPIKMTHHILLSKSETLICTTCKQFKGHMDNMYITTYQHNEVSEVTETVCEVCHKTGRK